jgi:hypothetical protein
MGGTNAFACAEIRAHPGTNGQPGQVPGQVRVYPR